MAKRSELRCRVGLTLTVIDRTPVVADCAKLAPTLLQSARWNGCGYACGCQQRSHAYFPHKPAASGLSRQCACSFRTFKKTARFEQGLNARAPHDT